MIAAEEANLRTLMHERSSDPLVRAALKRLLAANAGDPRLSHSLRHHREREVTDRSELDFREGVDRLLGLYSLLEIGVFARALPAHFPADVHASIWQVLTIEPLVRYFKHHYPLPLVQRLQNRVAGRNDARVDPTSDLAAPLFRAFLEADRQVASDPDVQTFQAMLDDFWWGEVGMPNLVKACQSPEAFGRALAGSPKTRKRVCMAARGLVDYLTFMTRLDELIERAGCVPGLSECFWLHYAYWFTQIGKKLFRELHQMLNQFRAWPVDSSDAAPGGALLASDRMVMVLDRMLRGPSARRRDPVGT